MPEKEHIQPEPSGKRDGDPRGVAAQGRQFFDDVREWVELRVELFQLDVEERIQDAVNRVAQTVAVVVLMALALLFLAMAAAFALGEWMGSTALGFLVVAVVGFLAAIGVKSSRPAVAPRLFQGDDGKSKDDGKKSPRTETPRTETPRTDGRRAENGHVT